MTVLRYTATSKRYIAIFAYVVLFATLAASTWQNAYCFPINPAPVTTTRLLVAPSATAAVQPKRTKHTHYLLVTRSPLQFNQTYLLGATRIRLRSLVNTDELTDTAQEVATVLNGGSIQHVQRGWTYVIVRWNFSVPWSLGPQVGQDQHFTRPRLRLRDVTMHRTYAVNRADTSAYLKLRGIKSLPRTLEVSNTPIDAILNGVNTISVFVVPFQSYLKDQWEMDVTGGISELRLRISTAQLLNVADYADCSKQIPCTH